MCEIQYPIGRLETWALLHHTASPFNLFQPRHLFRSLNEEPSHLENETAKTRCGSEEPSYKT
jgi:hypothetical protein